MWLSPATDHSDTSPMSSLLADSYTYREYREHSSSVQALPTDDGLLVLPALGDQQGVQHHCGQQKEIMSANGELPELKRIQVLLPHEGKEVSRKHAIKPQISLDGHHEVGAGKVRHGGVCLPIVQAQETENLNIILTVWQKLLRRRETSTGMLATRPNTSVTVLSSLKWSLISRCCNQVGCFLTM